MSQLWSWEISLIIFYTAVMWGLLGTASVQASTEAPEAPPPLPVSTTPAAPTTNAAPVQPRFFIREIRVQGGEKLIPKLQVEETVYPFLGPYRTPDDVEQARAALEKVYRDKGFQTVAVQIPPQQVKGGIIILQVEPNPVGRLRVTGARYFSPEVIKSEAPSLQEGKVPNFNDVTRDLVALNQMSDRRITPTVNPGKIPGTVDVDLNVKDSPPLHSSVEISNRYSVDTSQLRLNGSVTYDNLWQLGHTISGSFQTSPQNFSQVKVFSGYYSAPIPGVDGLSMMLLGSDQNSNVSTISSGLSGGSTGIGQTVGIRANFSLPSKQDFYHSASLGFDYKHYEQDLMSNGAVLYTTPITYYPFSLSYSATWIGKGYETDVNGAINFHLRGMGSSETEFDNDRHGADGSYIYFRGDVSHTRELPGGLQAFFKVQGQAADQPLVTNEQFSGGGLDTVRGFLESEVLGDNALLGRVELRSPSMGPWISKSIDDWRVYIFTDGGMLTENGQLAESPVQYDLLSVGAGTHIKVLKYINSSLDVGIPLVTSVEYSSPPTTPFQFQEHPYDARITFRFWAEF